MCAGIWETGKPWLFFGCLADLCPYCGVWEFISTARVCAIRWYVWFVVFEFFWCSFQVVSSCSEVKLGGTVLCNSVGILKWCLQEFEIPNLSEFLSVFSRSVSMSGSWGVHSAARVCAIRRYVYFLVIDIFWCSCQFVSSCSRVKLGGAVQLSWCSKMMSDVKPNLCASVSMFGSWRIISASVSVQLGDMCAFLWLVLLSIPEFLF